MSKEIKKVGVALQGGGSHGAFTWGVLDRLIEEDALVADAMCGTSAGAINAVVCAYGLHMGGPAKAKELARSPIVAAFHANRRAPGLSLSLSVRRY